MIRRAMEESKMEHNMFCYQCQETAGCTGCTRVGVCGKGPELAAMHIDEALAREFDRTVWDLADNLRVSDACDILDAIAEALDSFPDDVSDVYREAISIEAEEMRDNAGNRSPRYAFM